MGGKSKKATVGYWYLPAYHAGICVGEIDAFLEFRGGDATAWKGAATHSQTISINAPSLWGGEKDQGGIVGDVDLMFGEPGQQPNGYLRSVFGPQQPAWCGLTTLVFKGGKYGAMSPYPQKASYKVRKILQGWDRPCWYPEKASIAMGIHHSYADPDWKYLVTSPDQQAWTGPAAADFDDSGWSVGPGGFGNISPGGNLGIGTYISADVVGKGIWQRRTFSAAPGVPLDLDIWHDDGAWVWVNGEAIELTETANYFHHTAVVPASLVKAKNVIAVKVLDSVPGGSPTGIYAGIDIRQADDGALQGMNPAHSLYYARTHADIGREPVSNMNQESYQAAADRLYAEGFGICWEYDPSAESLEDFEQRICKLIGGSVSRSLVDGQYYLDLARGGYVLKDLPVITDDHILAFNLQPATLDGAVNSLSVKYFDPEKKEDVVTPPAQALGLIDAFGTIHQVVEYPEIPTAGLAALIAERDLRASCTPKSVLDLSLIPDDDAVRAIRPNQYFRLQAPKRRIADMVCLLGERQAGTLKSGAVRMTAAQDVYSLPSTAFVEVEPGVDTRPDPTPYPITAQAAFEAPYIELVQRIDRANMDIAPVDSGYLLAVADQPVKGGRGYDLTVQSADGAYEGGTASDWCPVAIVAGDPLSVEISRQQIEVALSAFVRADQVTIGSAALWDEEIVRVDSIGTDVVTLGRGCADTVPTRHSGGSRIWFYDDAAASDMVEYSEGEVVTAKLLTYTGSDQLALEAASPITVEFAGRQARPYPPASPTLNGETWPAEIFETADVAWSHRDRIAQVDQVVDQAMASIGPEPGTSYTVRWFLAGVLDHTAVGLAGTSATHSPASDGLLRVEIEAVRDGLVSWQMQVIECNYRVTPYSDYVDQNGELYADQNGDTYNG